MTDSTHGPGGTSADIPDWAYGVGSLVVFSGAGISTDSGIPDFRGPTGAWTLNPAGQHRHTYQAFIADPDLRVSYWRSRYEHEVWKAEPNASHAAVVSLVNSGIGTTVVTQNTDGLHQRAGLPADRVIELHGTMHVVVCVECGHRSPTTEVLSRIGAGEATPPCLRCGGILKTASTMFGQTIAPAVFSRAERAVTTCDLVLAVGTTLTVEPAGSLCASAVRAGATLVIVNLGPTPYDSIATEIIRTPLGQALPRIVGHLRAARSGVRPTEDVSEDAADPGRVPRPSQLLRAEARTARLHSRTAELERLTAWCAGTGVRIHLVRGPAGLGKSRLALELADRMAGDWDVEFLAPRAGLPQSTRPLLVVVDDAETRQEQVARIMHAASTGPPVAPIRVLLLARTQDGWWDGLRSDTHTDEELAPPDTVRSVIADAVQEATLDYAAALSAMGLSRTPDLAVRTGLPDATQLPGELQTSVLAGLLGLTGSAKDTLVRHELTYLRRAADEQKLGLSADVVKGAVATAILCGAADEEAAFAVLGHIPALEDGDVRLRVARWLRDQYPPGKPGPYWTESLPDALTEELIAAVVTPRFLMGMLMETTEEQDRRALTVLARAADTRPALRVCLTELLSVLPGVSPAAVDSALNGGYPAPLADALTALARSAALPAELLETVPAGTTVLGEFPVLLAESLVEAYEYRAKTYPETGLRGLTTMLIELAGRLTDLGRTEEALAAARRSVEAAGQLTEQLDYPARAAESLRRATRLAHREHEEFPQTPK